MKYFLMKINLLIESLITIILFRTQNARSKNSRGSIGRSQNSYNSLAKSSSGSSTGRFGNRSVSHSNRDGDTFNEEDPDHWITKYEQEMSTLQPRDGSAPNGSIPTAENTIPGINLTPATTEKSKKVMYFYNSNKKSTLNSLKFY